MMLNNFPDTVALVEYHLGDGYSTSWGNNRWYFYDGSGTPTVWVDGTREHVGAGSTSSAYSTYLNSYNVRQAVATDVTIELGAAMNDETATITAYVCVEAGGDARDMRIYITQVLDHYPSSPSYSHNTFKQAASTADIHVEPGNCETVQRSLTFDSTSWANQEDIRIIAWAQEQESDAPAEVFQAAVISWPFMTDCNNNGISDSEDIASGYSEDCDENGIPDECQPGGDQDCDNDGESDFCEVYFGAQDCNENWTPDECELDAGTAFDCNGNGLLDECDLAPVPYTHDSGVLSPIGYDSPQSYTIAGAPFAYSDVTLDVTAYGDLNTTADYLRIYVNGVSVGNVFDDTRQDCEEEEDTLVIEADTWNAAVAGGDAFIEITPTPFVLTQACGSIDTWVSVELSCDGPSPMPDLNGNGVPDVCERGDMNCDTYVNFDDIDGFVLAIVGQDSYEAEYPDCEWIHGDCDFNDVVNFDDIEYFITLQTSQ